MASRKKRPTREERRAAKLEKMKKRVKEMEDGPRKVAAERHLKRFETLHERRVKRAAERAERKAERSSKRTAKRVDTNEDGKLSAAELIDHAKNASDEVELQSLRDTESERDKPRKTVLEAIDKRLEELDE